MEEELRNIRRRREEKLGRKNPYGEFCFDPTIIPIRAGSKGPRWTAEEEAKLIYCL